MNKELLDKMNAHMTLEYNAAYIYLQMSNYLSSINLDGAANFMKVQSEEEISHANKFKDYLEVKGYYPTFGALEKPRSEYSNLLEVLTIALEHEKKVTAQINELYELAHELKDRSAQNFLIWFVDEQDEEEQTFNDLIDKYELYKEHLILFDKELGARQVETTTEQ